MEAPFERIITPAERLKMKEKMQIDLRDITRAHVESFNEFISHNLPLAVEDLEPVMFDVNDQTVTTRIVGCSIGAPSLNSRVVSAQTDITPAECRQCHVSYKGNITLEIEINVNGHVTTVPRYVGQAPIMVMSDKCILSKLTTAQKIAKQEEAREFGGYFIINGNEKVIRMLMMARRNHPMALIRPSFMNRGFKYTEYGVQIRCVRPDETSQRLVLHLIEGGRCTLGFSIRKRQYLIPAILLLRALKDVTERDIYEAIVESDPTDSTLKEHVKAMLNAAPDNTYSQHTSLEYLGAMFRIELGMHPSISNIEAARHLLKQYIFVHIPQHDYTAKYDLLIAMIRRLYALKSGRVRADNPDSPMNQEVLQAGQIYGALLKEQMQEYLLAMKRFITMQVNMGREVDVGDQSYFRNRVFPTMPDIGKALDYFLATGNLKSTTGLDQMQAAGFAIVADKLNILRYMSHFRCVHRGAYFAEMKTTAVRKLLPEAWGFICPVHTPDGAPCGLLNHLTRHCTPQSKAVSPAVIKQLRQVVHSLGVQEVGMHRIEPPVLDVFLDGVVVGVANVKTIEAVALKLREYKVLGLHNVPEVLEIAFIPPAEGGVYPGLYLFTTPTRMLRPVLHLGTNKRELISSLEQVYLDIGVDIAECHRNHEKFGINYTHMEISKHGMLSVVSSFTPFSDFNQSPRNMYQCQMGKQTMGIPSQAIPYRADNKLYVLNSGQTPVVHPRAYNEYNLDDYPLGNNAVVCVIAYTGYDMEDAMIINKGSIDRGFMHARVLKTEIVDLVDRSGVSKAFGLLPRHRAENSDFLDDDGLPRVGIMVEKGDPFYAVVDEEQSNHIHRYKGEPARIESVRLLLASDTSTKREVQRIAITVSVNRNPIIGDKFASRHGQKGILSQMLPSEDMPFTESGITPDIIFNPHGFPSRMTIGMLIESMAGKAGCLHERFYDSTPFQFDEDDTAVEFFGEELRKAGYNYFGHERMYSGITGEELEVDVFIGNVFYQRLRHMVSDKYQVRATGPVDSRTRQPIKGRKRHGGVRFGEMERDALIAHGTAFLLQDRLLRCSDDSEATVCKSCGGVLSTTSIAQSAASRIRKDVCLSCKDSKVVKVRLPYVFRYLGAELAGMNINMSLDVSEI
ncbi:RNA polymerase [Salpingoeca rosetta]|uniref:DNA-directed RNA polymerase subunit beta n=1 Tax=Salpingoeca rosetta (strain ATCC 50818 / BSB-021) TaxID=946362 RepID=F2ULU0_SALR5|nr:RNA polymerase [Salpingoeca rosetta]EGD78089.1 RNA polymerase [Salpingoeca rosetta]|eukprot:XP_004989765.1 RNA polymerase [Salpingoeca rosetta]